MRAVKIIVALSLAALTGALHAAPPPTVMRSEVTLLPAPSPEQQIVALQQQVQQLQSQMAALLSVLHVSAPATAGQRPTLAIEAGNFSLRADDSLSITAGSVVNVRAPSLALLASGGAMLKASGTLDLQGTLLRLNGGGKPIAMVGSLVQMQATGASGQVITGNPTVLAN